MNDALSSDLLATPRALKGGGKLRSHLRQLYRDVDSMLWAFRGRTPPPFAERDGKAYNNQDQAQSLESLAARPMQVLQVEPAAKNARAITLVPADGKPVQFTPGQFLTICATIDSKTVKRPYSICSNPSQNETVTIAVREVQNGTMSTYLCKHLKVGDTLNTYGPAGEYGKVLSESVPKHVAYIAAGSGITAQLALVRRALTANETTTCHLLYINRTRTSTMFQNELNALVKAYPSRFTLEQRWTKSGRERGHLTTESLAAFAKNLGATYFLCGPSPLMDYCEDGLAKLGVATERIHREEFTPTQDPISVAHSEQSESLAIHSPSGYQITTVTPGQTLLEAGLSRGAPLPFSCTVGGCGACKVQLVSGDITMAEPNCLSQEERASGHVLTCVAQACGPVVLKVAP